jgi:hypothetical protein
MCNVLACQFHFVAGDTLTTVSIRAFSWFYRTSSVGRQLHVNCALGIHLLRRRLAEGAES